MSADLLAQAQQLLDGELEVRSHSVRAACWLARNALEDEVRALLNAKSLDVGEASMRSMVSCLESAYRDDDPDLVFRVEYAWAGLSRASHHHAFELDPSAAEVRHLIEVVESVAGRN